MQPAQRKTAHVLFDEFHSESWSTSVERAREMEPGRVENSSYAKAAAALEARDFTVRRNIDQPLNPDALRDVDVLVLPHPCDARWERTTSAGSPALAPAEIEAVQDFVRQGGGLLLISEYEHDKYGDNLNELLAPAGLHLENGTAFDNTACLPGNPEWLMGVPADDTPLAHGVAGACFYRAGWASARGEASLAWKTSAQACPPNAGLIGIGALGRGRVLVVTDSVLFGDEHIVEFDHFPLWLNLVYWLAAPSASLRSPAEIRSESGVSEDWLALKAAVNHLRARQQSDGSVAADDHAEVLQPVKNMLAALDALSPRFPHQSEYFAALRADFARWEAAGFGRPDFAASLAAFQPQRDRRDEREHLVVLPLYTPNASSDTRFEALLMRTPWPDWLEALERSAFHNQKFAPGHLVDFTEGYASECAVLFPETVAVTGRAPNHFATIFCDREARRLQRSTRRGAAATGLVLFPELEFWLGSLPLIADTTALWDLIHDASHSVGELPFDPFMIRQRAPFWMYGLEELRVDLRSFEEASRLAGEGFPFARYVTWAILLDRILRFPITGPRVRNYDALGGQLLFAYLHQRDIVLWRDNRLSIRWDALADGIHGLRAELTSLYKQAADCSKLAFWLSGHELISRYIRPNVASQWKEGAHVINDERDLKRWISLVHEDEFPLGNFHLNLQRRLAALD
jgi:hypothetical protein